MRFPADILKMRITSRGLNAILCTLPSGVCFRGTFRAATGDSPCRERAASVPETIPMRFRPTYTDAKC